MTDVKQFYRDRQTWRNSAEEEKRFQRVTKFLPLKPDSKVLDIGCRDGGLKKYLPENICYTGLDIVDFGQADVMVADVNDGIKLPGGSFDYVFCIELLEHIKNPVFVLGEIHRVLKDEGTFILTVPNPYHFKEVLWNLFKVKDRQGHIFSWTRQTMERLCEFCRFQLVDTSGTYFIPRIGCGGLLARSVIYKLRKCTALKT